MKNACLNFCVASVLLIEMPYEESVNNFLGLQILG